MATWNEIGDEIQRVQAGGGPHDVVRRRYLARLSETTGRNTISYYSGWLQKSQIADQFWAQFSITDNDKNGFMATVHGLDHDKGLDLLLHTPGGGIAAAESLVSYLRSMFRGDIRVIVPQLAMSAGTMIACASLSIVMGKHSSLGPIDPQIHGVPAHGVLEEFERAVREIKEDPNRILVWREVIGKYQPSFIGDCEKAIDWSNEMVKEWLVTGMFAGKTNPDPEERAEKVIRELGNHALTKSHDRHISIDRALDAGLEVIPLEDDPELQDVVLSVHHATTITLAGTAASKIIENQLGRAFISMIPS